MKKPLKLAAAIAVAGAVFSSASAVPLANANSSLHTSTSLFSDVKAGTKLEEAVAFLIKNQIASGYGAEFGVNDPIKREDFAVMLGHYMKVDTVNVPKSSFTDLPPRVSGTVSALKAKGIVNGKTAVSFGAGNNITRGEAVIMLHRAFKDSFSLNKSLPFTDVSSSYREAVGPLFHSGIIAGLSSNKFGTNTVLTRGQMALLIKRIDDFHQSLKAEKKSGFVAFGDSNTSGSYFESQYQAYLNRKWTDQVAAVYGNGMDYNFYNKGNSGDETAEGLLRFKKDVLDAKPESVTIMFGINDALLKGNGEPQVSKEKFKSNLVYMLEQLHLRGITAVLMTNTPVVEKTYYDLELKNGRNVMPLYAKRDGLRNWINSYNEVIREAARDRSIPLVDVYNILTEKAGGASDAALMRSNLLDDVTGIHMTPEANDIVAQAVKEILAKEN